MKKHCDELGYGRGGMSDTVYEAYKNVSCLFKAAEERVPYVSCREYAGIPQSARVVP